MLIVGLFLNSILARYPLTTKAGTKLTVGSLYLRWQPLKKIHMSYYALTLIIDKQTSLTDAKLLESLKLYKLDNSDIGKENARYQECLTDFNKTYVCSTDDLIIITGLPAIKQCYKTKTIPFQDFIGDSRFFIFLSESVEMHHIICFGQQQEYVRRKIVSDGKYYYSKEKGDVGELLIQELNYFKTQKSLKNLFGLNNKRNIGSDEKELNTSYLMGTNDYDISLQILRKKFSSLSFPTDIDLENHLEDLVFNKNIEEELSKDYLTTLKSKFKRGDLKKEVIKYFNAELKNLGFVKELYSAPPPRDVYKNTRFKDSYNLQIVIEHFHNELFQESNLVVFINSFLDLPQDLIALLEKERYIELKCNYPFFSFQIATSHKINKGTDEKIFIKRELKEVFASYSEDFKVINNMQTALKSSILTFFIDSSLWHFALRKIEKSIERYGINKYSAEFNFCIAHIYYVKDIVKLEVLNDILMKSYGNLHVKNLENTQRRLKGISKYVK